MVRLGVHVVAVMLLLGSNAWAETILLTRTNNGNEQKATSVVNATSDGGIPDPDDNMDEDDYSATSTASAESANGANVGHALDVSTAVCNTAPTGTSYNPSVNVVTGGPMIVTGTATARGMGNAASSASFVVGNPTNPGATLVMTGTITIIASPGTHTSSLRTIVVTIGGSTISYSPAGCVGTIKDISVPGGQYTVSSPSSVGGTWQVSEYTSSGATIGMSGQAAYEQWSTVPCSDYPDFNGAAFMTVNTQ